MSELEELMFVNNCVCMMVPGEVLTVETKRSTYEVMFAGGFYFVSGGMYSGNITKLQRAPYIETQGNFIFHDNPVFKHYVTRTSEVEKVSINDNVIFTNGR